MKKIWKILRGGLLFFLIAILTINIYIISAQAFFNKELPKVAGFAQIIVISGSMQPTIQVGDLLIIHEKENYREQDIITYRSNGRLVTHRILEIDTEHALVRGDANNVTDDPVPLENIEGKTVLRIPMAGSFILFLKTPVGMLLMVLSVIAIYMLFELPVIIRGRDSKNDGSENDFKKL